MTLKRRILFVDDEPRILKGLQRMLHKMRKEWDIDFAEGGIKALEMLGTKNFDVVVTDMRMPGMDGFTFAQSVKSGGPWSATPLVALSAHATPTDIDRGRAVGFDDYVAKFDRDAILSSLNETLSTLRGAA